MNKKIKENKKKFNINNLYEVENFLYNIKNSSKFLKIYKLLSNKKK